MTRRTLVTSAPDPAYEPKGRGQAPASLGFEAPGRPGHPTYPQARAVEGRVSPARSCTQLVTTRTVNLLSRVRL
jgi:hypothetical protein